MTSLVSTPARLLAEAGASVVGRGLLVCCGREAIYNMGMLGLGPSIRRYCTEKLNMSGSASSVAGAIGGGVICATISHPLDTIKTCLQGDIARAKYSTVGQTAGALWAEGGVRRLLSGWGFRTGRMILQVFLVDKCRQVISPAMFPRHFN